MKKEIIKQWDKIAQRGGIYRRKLPVDIGKYLKKKSKILDLGSGTGSFKTELEKHGKIIYSDISIEMLKKGQVHPSVDLSNCVNCDASVLPFRSSSFDAVTSFNMFHLLPTNEDRLNVLNEMYRVLKNSGVAIISFGYVKKVPGKIRIPWKIGQGAKTVQRTYYSLNKEGVSKLLEKSKFENYSISSSFKSSKKVVIAQGTTKFEEKFNNFVIILRK